MSIFSKIKKGIKIAGIIIPQVGTVSEVVDLIHSNDKIDNKEATKITAKAVDELNQKVTLLMKKNEELEAKLNEKSNPPRV